MDNGINIGSGDDGVLLPLYPVPQRGQDMLGKAGFMLIAVKGYGIATVGNADAQQFFKVIDVGVVFAVQKGNKGEIVKFQCSDGNSPRLNFTLLV